MLRYWDSATKTWKRLTLANLQGRAWLLTAKDIVTIDNLLNPHPVDVTDEADRLLGKVYQGGTWTTARDWLLTAKDIATIDNLLNPHPVDVCDEATRLLGIIYGDKGQLAQRATSKDAYIAVRQGGSELSNSNPLPVTNVVDPATAVPTGAILAYGGTAAPPNFLLCDGSEVSRTVYAALFGVIGTAYGIGDGTTTFNLPDLRQRFPLGKAASGTGSTLGGTGGAIDHTHSQPVHHHALPIGVNDPNVTIANYPHGTGGSESSAWRHGFDRVTESFARLLSEDAGNDATGGANPAFQTVNYIIKT